MHPKIVIIGRPNVGKSSLFNMLAGRRVSIIDPLPGVTRDRISTHALLPETPDTPAGEGDRHVELVDTGGYGIHDTQDLAADVERQIRIGVTEADLVLFVVDAQTGVLPLDEQIARLLRQRRLGEARSGAVGDSPRDVPVLLIANKVDSHRYEAGAAEAARLGLGDPVMVSAKSAHLSEEFFEAVRRAIDWSAFPDSAAAADLGVLLAIVGKRNAGKSTLVNALAGQERVIVSEIEGTTRDAVDVRFEMGGRVFTAIDTAGVRKGKSLRGDMEYYSQHRALRSVRRADVTLFLIDASVPVSQVDQKLAMEIQRHFKPTVLVVNKWDLAQGKANTEDYGQYLTRELRGLDFAPIVFTCARTGEGVGDLVSMAFNLHQQSGHRVPTAELNRVFQEIVVQRPPTSGIGRPPRIYYATQLGVHPPTLALFVNDPSMFDAAYQRFLLHRLRDLLPYAETPIRLVIRRRPKRQAGSPPADGPRADAPPPFDDAPGNAADEQD